jgi:foldase protein PrsA
MKLSEHPTACLFSLVTHIDTEREPNYTRWIESDPRFGSVCVLRKYLGLVSIIMLVTWVLVGCSQLMVLPSAKASPSAVIGSNRIATPSATRVQPGASITPVITNTLEPEVIAVVNGTSIRTDEYGQQVALARVMYIDQAGLDPNSEAGTQLLAQVRQQVFDAMIDQILIHQAAVTRNILITDAQVDDAISQMKGQDNARFQQWLQENNLTEASLRQRLASDLVAAAVRDAVIADLPRQQAHIHARYLFTTDQAKAQEALARIKAGENFGDMARLYSMDETTRASGGDLGFIPHGVMPLSFDQAAFALSSNQISDIVTVDSGYMIIQVLEIDPARTVSDENWPLVQQYTFETWLANQRAQATIVLNPTNN